MVTKELEEILKNRTERIKIRDQVIAEVGDEIFNGEYNDIVMEIEDETYGDGHRI